MILEYTQILCTALHILIPDIAKKCYDKKLIYKKTHYNHPCCIWARNNISNFKWLIKLTKACSKEHQFRYKPKHIHKSMKVIKIIEKLIPLIETSIPGEFSDPPMCMPDQYKSDNCIEAYRNYYNSPDKKHLISYKNRDIPDFIK